jgi:oligopeptide/dipeptide ABC transporter ATP-binding protein
MSLVEIETLTLDVQVVEASARVIHEVSFKLEAGQSIGIVGESGSGKSLTLRAIAGLSPENSVVGGKISFQGEEVSAMERERLMQYRSSQVAMIFQDPRSAINPVRKVGDFLTENVVTNLGWSKSDAKTKAIEVLTEVGISNPEKQLKAFPSELSGGMLQRVMIASNLLCQPDLLLADEPTTALDVTTQSSVMALIDQLRVSRGMAMIFVSHNLELATAVCDKILVMYAGRIVELLPAENLREKSRHPYTRALLDARPRLDGRQNRLNAIPGQPASGLEWTQGCTFAARCAFAQDICRSEVPVLRKIQESDVACHRADEIDWDVS